LTVGATYHIKLIVTDVNDGAYDSGVFLQASSFSSPVVLPVELIAFDAKCNEAFTEVKWETASEKNNDYFLLQRAGEDLIFETIATIKGNGNSNSVKQYFFKDNTNLPVNYYQLIQVDKDGTRSTSKMLISKNTCKTDFIVNTVYYNMANQNIFINYDAEENKQVTVTIFDLLGKVVYTTKKEMITGLNVLQLDANDLGSGIYVCAFSTLDYNVVKKIIIN